MKKLLFLLILFPLRIHSEEITLEAIRTLNGYAGASDYCMDAASTSDGGIVTSGYSSDGFTSYALLIKYNSSGEREWLKTFRNGINSIESYSKISTDLSGNIYVAGGTYNEITNYDILIQKYSPSGNLIWTKKINSSSNSSDVPVEFKRDYTGNLLVLFNEQGTSHINLAKLDINGNLLWHYRLADTVSSGSSMAIDSLNNIYIAGDHSYGTFSSFAFMLKLDEAGNVKWKREGVPGNDGDIQFSKMKVRSNNEIYVFGVEKDGFDKLMKIQKIDSSGNMLWSKIVGVRIQGTIIAKALELDNSGNVFYGGSIIPIITDNSGGNFAGYNIGKLSPLGDTVWNRSISNWNMSIDNGFFMKINNTNNVFVLCDITDMNFKKRGKIFKYSSGGDLLASGNFNDTYSYLFSLVLDNSGNPVGCGSVFQKYNEYDHFVKSYNSSCQPNWESKYDSKGFSSDAAGRVLEDKEGNIYIAGYNNRQAILIKYNEAMTEQWKYIISDTIGYDPYYNFVPSIVSDNSGNIYFATSVKFDSTAYDILISKIDPSGNNLFSIRIAAPENNTAQLRAITIDDLGYLIVSGATDVGFIAKYNPSGNQMWVRNYTEFYYYQKLIAKDDEIYFMGDNSIIKYAKTGDELWARTFQPNSHVHFFLDFEVDKERNVIACGSGVFPGTSEDYIIVKYDTEGDLLWNESYDGLGYSNDEANSLAVDTLNNIIVSGSAFESTSSSRASITMIKLDPEGDQIWKKIISNPNGEIAAGKVNVDKFNDVYVSSGGGRNAGFAHVNFSYLLVKYKSNGDSLWSVVYNHPRYKNYASDFVITKNNSIVITGKAYGNNTGYDITTLKYSHTIGIQSSSTEFPDNFKLDQNYPNPFNPNTVISYQLAVSSFAKLKVYDILGSDIATLVNEKQNAGSYSVEFNGANYPSGIYYYKLEAGDFNEVKKMILLK